MSTGQLSVEWDGSFGVRRRAVAEVYVLPGYSVMLARVQDFETRVGAYGIIVDGDSILLAHFNANGSSNWTLPGGGLEFGEDCEAAAVREIREETGYVVELGRLLGVDSVQIPSLERIDLRERHLHSLRVIYEARVVAGDLVREIGGSTDDVRWFRLSEVTSLKRVDLVEAGIELWRRSRSQFETAVG